MFYIPAVGVEGHVFFADTNAGVWIEKNDWGWVGDFKQPQLNQVVSNRLCHPSYGTNDRGVRGELLAP